MGKGRPRAVEKGVLGQGLSVLSSASLNVPPGPVYYPTEDEFKNPLAFICKIRAEAEPYGICKIVPPKSWKPPFALDMNCFTFPTKTQAIHQLQARPAACDPGTFELEYNRFLEEHHGRKAKKRVVFEGEDMDLCRFFNAVKRYGGYDKVVDEKKWGDVFRFVRRGKKISECSKHVLSQLYWEYLYDYEKYYNQLNNEMYMGCKRGVNGDKDSGQESKFFGSKRRRRNYGLERVEVCKMEDIEPNQICEQCKSGSHGEVMLLCDKCNKGWHIYCLSPPLKQVPLGNWYCLECFNSDKDTFGFVPGKRFSLEAFRRMAERVKKKWFGSVPVSRTQLERKFWEIVEGLAGEVEVVYGSDLDTSVYGSGFPRANNKKPESVEDELWDAYCSSPWNLNNLPKLRGSMLRAVHHNIAGVMVPWLYIGMLFSSFCWHFEDHCFYSMNYLHWGEPKCWYSVPGSEVCAFEEVMRKSLPDLFDAQPDLLFQLVTMLNPSVLRENGVPVFSILQEPGNFVITFPRSYHAGFNFGLNCAEAVNFAPADWLPHGGFAANLYQQYHRAAVLSHEELLCVVAKNDHDAKTSSYLKKELFRMYSKEKTWRERLWRSGVVYSSRMAPRKFPMYVGTEEDPTCIICQQSLYLSAIICCCRPSTFVCLEHWKHLCECKPRKHRLLYRNSLAELEELVLATDDLSSDRTPQRGILQEHLSCLDRTSDLTKKVKGANVSFFQLAENWLLRARKALRCPYSSAIYAKALKEAEQFLWAGSEMDSVRDMTKKLVESQNWAEDIICCLSKIEKRPCHRSHKSSKVHLEHINNLLSTTPFSCYDSGHLRLKEFAEQARILIREMNTTLTSCSEVTIAELGKLYKKACDFPVYAEEIENLADKISAMKVWMSSVSKCFIERTPAAIKVDMLHKLKSEMLELQVQVPERELLLDLLRRAEFCRMHCSDILKGPMTLKGVEMVLQEFESFSVDIPELRLLRQHYADAISWISRFNDVSLDIHEREDQENVVDELNCILKDGASLKIKVDELPRLEIELKKACLRHRAMKAMASKMSTDLMNQIMAEALVLQVENEKSFIGVSRVREAAMHWEERARDLFACRADISDFEHALRTADDISAILPSLDDVRDAISMANSWLKNSRPFLRSVFSVPIPSSSLLKVEDLKELVSQSKLLNISLQEQTALERVLTNCEEWEEDACCLIQKAECLLNTDGVGDGLLNNVTSKIGSMVQKMESVIDAGLVLGFQFNGTPKLQEARSSLKWCSRALSFCSVPSTLEEVHNLLDVARNIPVRWASTSLFRSLVEGIEWLREALEAVLLVSHNHKRCKLSDAEDILAESRAFNVFFPWMVDQLIDAIRKHRSWQDEVSLFFNLKFTERSWSRLLHLKELGDRAFNCTELDFLLSEVEKIDKWRQKCLNSIGPSVGGVNNLLGVLLEIKDTLKKSLYIYDQARSWNMIDSCMWCFTSFKGKELSSCSICKDCFHLQCIGLKLADAIGEQVYKCPYCLFVETGSVPWDGGISFRTEAKGPELKMLLDLLSDSQDFCVWIDEKHALEKVLEEALACKAHLAAITDYALAYLGEDVSVVAKKLTIALKAVKMAGVNYCQGNSNLDLALERNSWRIRSCKLLEGPRKPSLQQIQRSVKEALALGIQPGDCFWQKLTGLEQIGLQWADSAKKVVRDSGALGLDKVFDLIIEGEKLPVHFEKELRSLRERSKLYCICRKPDDRRAMIACDLCDEWYHFDCMRLSSVPKFYICPACKPQMEELSSSQSTDLERSDGAKFGVPRTPSPPCSELRAAKAREPKRKVVAAKEGGGNLPPIASSGIGLVSWQNCRPFRRRAKKRAEFQSISPFYHTK